MPRPSALACFCPPPHAPSVAEQSIRLSRPGSLNRSLNKLSNAATSDDDDEEELLSMWGGIGWLAMATVLIAIISEALTGALEGAAKGWGLTKSFVGFCLLPIVGNAAEYALLRSRPVDV
eukprot:scaffold287584_cov30-Tisochrysis_lutea.AAC.3